MIIKKEITTKMSYSYKKRTYSNTIFGLLWSRVPGLDSEQEEDIGSAIDIIHSGFSSLLCLPLEQNQQSQFVSFLQRQMERLFLKVRITWMTTIQFNVRLYR